MKRAKKFLSVLMALVMLFSLTSVMAIGTDDYETGDIIQFGSYPQTKVTDEAIVAELNALAPEWDSWISYGYYSGLGDPNSELYDEISEACGTIVQGDWMKYVDIAYNGETYRGIRLSQYRPSGTLLIPSETYQADNGYYINVVYWFKYEPISWKILDPETGLVISELLIDAQPFNNEVYYYKATDAVLDTYFNDSNHTYYANNYEVSSVRQWLNNEFYITAFKDSEKEKIKISTIANGDNDYPCNSTNDKVFLLGYELENTSYNSVINSLTKGSDYAKAQGLYVFEPFIIGGEIIHPELAGYSPWHLRLPGVNSKVNASSDVTLGFTSGEFYRVYDVAGIRPMMRIDFDTSTPPVPPTPPVDPDEPNEPENTFGIIVDSDIYAIKVTGVESNKIFTILDGKINAEKISAWDITLTVNGVETQPDGEVTVKIPVPAGYNPEKCKIYHIDPATGKLTDMNAVVENGYFVFNTDHFSIYSIVELHEHSFGNNDAECNCGFDRTENCSCNCHKSGFMGFIWKIINFFQKLFRINPTCVCGIAHY